MLISKRFGVAAWGAAGVLLLAGCGSGGSSPAVSSPSATASSPTSGPAGRGFRRPGVSGVIASRSGSSATVDATSGSASKVTWTAATAIVEQQPSTAAAMKNGACVSIRMQGPARPGGARPTVRPSGVRPSGTGPSGRFTVPSKVTAATVTILVPSACSRARSGSGGLGGFSGTVSGVSGGGFSMTVTFGQRPSGSASRSAPSVPPTPKIIAVTTNSSTTYMKDAEGSASSVVAGECMTALGTASGSTLTARQITISQTVNGSCASGFGGFGSGGRGSSGSGPDDA